MKLVKKLFNKIINGVAPPRKITISEWADEYRVISAEGGAEQGKWSTDRAPYQREIMNSVSDPDVEKVVIMSAIQIGKTEFLLNMVAYFIDVEPSPMMYVLPQLDMCKDFSKTRISTMIRDVPCLNSKIAEDKSRDGKNNIMMKMFPGGYLKIAGSNSEASLRSAPLRVVLLDEVDAYPKSAGAGGDPSKLADGRTSNFYNRKVVMVSSPLTKGDSRIEDEFNTSTMEEWCHKCHNCGEYVGVDLNLLNFEQEELTMTCPHCGCTANEYEWKSGEGKWIAKYPGRKKRGFHITSFSSPWVSWEKLKDEYLEAKGKPLYMKTFINMRMGLPYEQSEETVDYEILIDKREEYEAQVPDPVLCLTCGVDTQDDRLEAEVVGWLKGEESYGIERKVIRGDTSKDETWEELWKYLDSSFYYEDGTPIKISCTCVDSGGHRTSKVYKFCREHEHQRVFAIKGMDKQIGIPLIYKWAKTKKYGNTLFILGVNDGKEALHSRLNQEYLAGGCNDGYCHFPMGEDGEYTRGYDKEYFKGLFSEKLVKEITSRGVRMYWKKISTVRNEPLDIRNYAQAAIKIFNPKWETLARCRQIAVKHEERTSQVRKRRVFSKGVV